MDGDFIKLLADLGGMGVALALIVAVYRFASMVTPRFLDMVGNHFKENAAALTALKDSVQELIAYLRSNNHN